MESIRQEIASKENEGASLGQEMARLEVSNHRKGSGNSNFSWVSANEKSHAIKVLEHEGKIFNFEKNISGKPGYRG